MNTRDRVLVLIVGACHARLVTGDGGSIPARNGGVGGGGIPKDTITHL